MGPRFGATTSGQSFVGLAPVNIVRNVPDADSHHWTWDITATRRFTGRWSLVAGFAHTWSRDQASGYFGQSVRNNVYPLTPNDLINAGEDGRYEFRIWSAKIHGTYAGPWDLRITPFLRHQSGQPFGRTFSTALNYANNVRILAEPIGTRRMDNITLLDVRVEKGFRLAGTPPRRRVRRCLQPAQRQSGAEHELVVRAVLPAAAQHRAAATRADRCEAGVVMTTAGRVSCERRRSVGRHEAPPFPGLSAGVPHGAAP